MIQKQVYSIGNTAIQTLLKLEIVQEHKVQTDTSEYK